MTCDDELPTKPNITIELTPYAGLMKFLSKYTTIEEREQFLSRTLPHIVNLIEKTEEYLMECGGSLVYNQSQQGQIKRLPRSLVASIVASGILCLFPDSPDNIEIPGVNFTYFYRHTRSTYQRAKFRCILNYMHQLSQLVTGVPKGFMEVQRVVLPQMEQIEMKDLLSNKKKLCPLVVCPDGKIEDAGSRVLQLDFANEYLGGGVLNDGNVQEEILFCLCPELIAAMLFVEKMDHNESITIQGFEKYSASVGYGGSFRFAPPQKASPSTTEVLGDKISNDFDSKVDMSFNKICAIDATPYGQENPDLQYQTPEIMREFNKAYAGFKQPGAEQWADNELEDLMKDGGSHTEAWAINLPPQKVRTVATGNWGCGVFGGDPQMKAMLQWLAASHARCPAMVYYTFQLWSCDYFEEVVRAVGPAGQGWRICDLAEALHNYAQRYNQCNFFQVLLKESDDKNDSKTTSDVQKNDSKPAAATTNNNKKSVDCDDPRDNSDHCVPNIENKEKK